MKLSTGNVETRGACLKQRIKRVPFYWFHESIFQLKKQAVLLMRNVLVIH